MNKQTFAQTVAIVAGATVAGISVAHSIKTHRVERARREQIESDLQLDLAAIKRAGQVVSDRIHNGNSRTLPSVMDDFHNEVAFQKIIIREK